MHGKVSMIFIHNCFLKYFKVRRPTGGHVHSKSGSIKEMVQNTYVVTTHQCHMAYLFVSFPVTLNDPEGHSRNEDSSIAIRRTFV